MNNKTRHILRLDIKTPVEYWHKYWEYLLDELKDKDSHRILLRTPRLIIEDIIEELSQESIHIRENLELFKSELSEWIKEDKAFKKLFGTESILIIRKISDNNQRPLLLKLCKAITDKMDKGEYFDSLLTLLEEMFLNKNTISYEIKEEINKLTESIVTEFLCQGFDLDDLNNLTEASSRDEEDCIEADIKKVKEAYFRDETKRTILFRLEGIKGKINYNFGEIRLYSPKTVRLLKQKESFSKIEECERDEVNAAVFSSAKAPRKVIENAKEKLSEALDLLTLRERPSSPIFFDDDYISTINEEGKEVGITSLRFPEDIGERAKNKARIAYECSLDITDLRDKDDFSKELHMLLSNQDETARKLKLALHWSTKSSHAEIDEDKILFAWISLESLFTFKQDTIKCITGKENANTRDTLRAACSVIMGLNAYYYILKHLFDDLYYYTHSHNNYFEIPKEVLDKSELSKRYGEPCDKNIFRSSLSSLECSVNDEIMKNRIHEVKDYYDQGLTSFKERSKYYGNLITLFYRIRNMEVHRASFSPLTKFYVPHMTFLTQQLIYIILDEYVTNGRTIDDSVLYIKMRYDKLVLRLSENN